jgi:hypothetical protein
MKAQYGVGDWKIHSVFGSTITNLIDAGDKVYYLVSSNLYCFDKTTQENEALNKRNYLSDVNIRQIYYNNSKKYLLIVYDDSNIDLILSSGKVINMPDIKDAEMTGSKTINDVSFATDVAYVATDFGYVVINDTKYEVKESRIYNTVVNSVIEVGSRLLLSADNKLYYGALSDHHSTLSSFNSLALNNSKLLAVNSNAFFANTGWLYLDKIIANADGTISLSPTECAQSGPITMQKTTNGFIANFHYTTDGGSTYQNYYITFDANGENPQKVTLSENELYSSLETDGSWWAVGVKGLHKITGGQSSGYYKPSGLTMDKPYWMTFNKSQNKLYVSNTGPSQLLPTAENKTIVNTLSGSEWADVTPTGTISTGGVLRDTYYPVFDATDANTYYLGSWFDGIMKITDGKKVLAYDWTNSPLVHALDGYYCHTIITLDRNGHLWVVQTDNTTTPVMVLSKTKLQSATVTASDWYTPSVANVVGNKRASFLACQKSNVEVYANGSYEQPVVFWNDGGNVASSGFTSRSYTSFLDQDDKSYTWTVLYAITEDQNGRVWIGSSNGVISLNPTEAFNDDFRINRIKVPRNDGTSLADYLLDGQQVNCIAVDGANRKWIGTDASGLFLVSSDGSEILKQFNTSNSYLTSNQIYRVCCNPNTNSVYVITSNGFLEYFSDSTPAEASYDNVYAYPNPVKPDFTGLITIKGLMDNSLVKIADSSGNVFYSTRSNGGMATWDGCNYTGQRVKSGVYYVLASQNEDGQSSGVVTKIVVIR